MRSDRVAAAAASAGMSSDVFREVAFREASRDGLGGVALDFGAGSGEFASRLAATGLLDRVFAADVVRSAEIPEGIEWIDADLNELLPLPPDSVDLIAAIEIVEHLENVRATCREWARLLRPGGRVVLTAPNNESIRALLSLVFRGHFIAFVERSYPAHITALVRTDISRALRESGLEPQHFFFTDDGSVPKLTQLTWQQLRRGRLRGLRFSDNLGCVAFKPTAEKTST
jgi:2-polyprenyl-3-methyl-5-hydroxy-6-metoxy-1,4-benzoquinol methylase